MGRTKINSEIQLLQTLATQGIDRMTCFECRYSLPTIVSTISGLPTNYVSNAISYYQGIIRNNMWYFPLLHDVDLATFLIRWGDVHKIYFELANEIFNIIKTESLISLVNSSLLTRVIQSETMRGWVGKRSPSGLDALLGTRISQLDNLLAALNEDDVDDIHSYGGIYIDNPKRITAEREIIKLFSAYHNEVGQEFTISMLDKPNEAAKFILRDYCRYSFNEFNEKYRALRTCLNENTQSIMSENEALDIVKQRMSCLTSDTQKKCLKLLYEIRILNHLNLNLEVKYSFKGWAGLMHILVVILCKDATGIDYDVYDMRNALIKKEGK